MISMRGNVGIGKAVSRNANYTRHTGYDFGLVIFRYTINRKT